MVTNTDFWGVLTGYDPSGYVDVFIGPEVQGIPQDRIEGQLSSIVGKINNFLMPENGQCGASENTQKLFKQLAHDLDPTNKSHSMAVRNFNYRPSWKNMWGALTAYKFGESNPTQFLYSDSLRGTGHSFEVYTSAWDQQVSGIDGFHESNIVHEFSHFIFGSGHNRPNYSGRGVIDNQNLINIDMEIDKADEAGAYYHKFIK